MIRTIQNSKRRTSETQTIETEIESRSHWEGVREDAKKRMVFDGTARDEVSEKVNVIWNVTDL